MDTRKEHVDRSVMRLIGQRIKQARKAKKVSQTDLATAFNLNQSRVTEWESGKYSPHISLVPRLADILGVSIEYFFKEEDVDPESIP
jgi:transcriptional regulator with XRE-family HTH domain